MKKILLFADAHANYENLENLANCEDFKTADEKIFLGDIVIGDDEPNKCIDFLRSMGCRCLLGNNDQYVCDHIPKEEYINFPKERILNIENNQKIISLENKAYILSWRREYSFEINNKKFYLTHYPWISDENIIDNPKEVNINSRKDMFKKVDADYIIFAHEHVSSLYQDENKVYLCISPLKFGFYTVLTINNEINIEEKRV